MLFPHFFNRNITPNLSVPNMTLHLENYQKEVMKIQNPCPPNSDPKIFDFQPNIPNGAQDLSMPKEPSISKDSSQLLVETASNKSISETIENEDYAEKPPFNHQYPLSELRISTPINLNNLTEPSPLSNSILTPSAMSSSDDLTTSVSPLQRMASITNSLISQPTVLQTHNTQQRPSKAILPPITQQQFDLFSNLNTEDIVRRVKEALSQYSISQRLFGESVLGLSQGSVSDLLARPKPWHMLTQKGREPFIRMKMFLEDDNAVHKLVASQYKIAPEKLMRTGNYAPNPQLNHVLNNKINATNTMQKIMNEMQHIQASAMPMVSHHSNIMLNATPIAPSHLNSPFNQILESRNNNNQSTHQQQQHNIRNMNQHKSPTVYEMAALTQDLDTQVITTKIKEALLAHNIGQKIFGEVVLGLSQGSVSELLSKPKPWHMLSIKGREPFIRMQLWLTDPNNIERLQYIKNERREASKKRKSSGLCLQDNSSDTSSNDTSDFYATSPDGLVSTNSSNSQLNKKQRVLFSEEQKEALRVAFTLDPYPNVSTIEFLASELDLATRTITNWFHNHRMRLKQQLPHNLQPESLPSRDHSNTFDPAQFKALLNQKLIEQHKTNMNATYKQCYANHSNLATLLSSSLIPSCNEQDLHTLNAAFKEQMKGLDLSLNCSMKKDNESNNSDAEENKMSDTESLLDDSKSFSQNEIQNLMRTSRRKPAAPQWVNPDWQGSKKVEDHVNSNESENGLGAIEIPDNLKSIHTEVNIKKENEEAFKPEESLSCNFS